MPTRPPVHQAIGAQTSAQRKAAYEAYRRSQPRHYGRRWEKLRAAYLATHPLCECGCNQVATVVDHKRPHLGDEALMYDWDNLQSMTRSCHNKKTATHDGGFGHPMRR